MKIKEITLTGKDDPIRQEHVELTQIPMFQKAAQRLLNQTGFPDIQIEVVDVMSADRGAANALYMVQVNLTRKTETETFLVIFASDSPVIQINYVGMRSFYEVQDFQQGADPTQCIGAAIGQMADILFGHLACRV